jgi:dolichyl-phosphate-mannose-protein mannosyltransferase
MESLTTGLENRSMRQWAVILLPALLWRIIYAWQIAGQPVFDKYLTLAESLLKSGVTTPFTSSPIYTLWIALCLKVAGRQPDLFRCIQFLGGVVSLILTVKIATRIFGFRTGTLAGILYAFFAPALIYEGDLVTASWVVLLSLWALHAILSGESTQHPEYWGLAGFLLGIVAGIRPNMLLLPIFCMGYGLCTKAPVIQRVKRACFLGMGAAVAILPITAINTVCGNEFVPITASGGSVFYSSNNFRATGLGYSPPEALTELENQIMQQGTMAVPVEHQLFKYLAERAAGRHLTYRDVSRFYFREGLRYLQQNPKGSIYRAIRKLCYFFNRYEVHDTASLIRGAGIANHRFPFLFGFGVIWVLGSTGFLYALKHQRHTVLLSLFMIPHVMTGVLFYVNGRLRMPVAPILIIFSGYALIRI